MLFALICLILVSAAAQAAAPREFSLKVNRTAEAVMDLEMSSPGSDWGEPGREAAVLRVSVEGRPVHHVILWGGAARRTYSVFLGPLPPGEHRILVERDAAYSASGSGLEIAGARFRETHPGDDYHAVLANAPVLYARPNTVGRFSDVPLLVYCERIREGGRDALQYTVVFSNEDGGTSTRALMARWGRTTDIEYVYRAWLDGRGAVVRGTIQGKDHEELEFRGERDGAHPLLYVSTDNNMVAGEGSPTVRYQLAPVLVDLSGATRESVMDADPETWEAMAKELKRERKLRPFGSVYGETISDPRNYLYIDVLLVNRNTAVAVLVRRRGEQFWRSSNLGRLDYAIPRSGWVRTTVELPPGTSAEDLVEIGFQCLMVPDRDGKWPQQAGCQVESVGKAFFLGRDYRPRASFWSWPGPATIPAGHLQTLNPGTDGTVPRNP